MDSMFLTVSRSGSDWFMSCLDAGSPDVNYYHKEFFNPITCIPKYRNLIASSFGDENHPENIVCGVAHDDIEDIYTKTWCKENYNTVKETRSAFKVAALKRFFDLYVLYRSPLLTFPGNTAHTVKANRATYISCRDNLDRVPDYVVRIIQGTEVARPVEEALVGYMINCAMLLGEVRRDHGIPVIEYDKLLSGSEDMLCMYLEYRLPYYASPEGTAKRIVASREPKYSEKNKVNFLADVELCKVYDAVLAFLPLGIGRVM